MRSRIMALMAAVAFGGWLGIGTTAAMADGEVNLYSYRQEFLIRPFLDKFTQDTGIKVNVVYAKEGVLERLKSEGENTPADAVLTVDISRLKAIADEGLLQPVESDVLDKNIPAQYRDPNGLWYGLTARSRIIIFSEERVKPGAIKTYEDLADPKWKGKICVRSGSHVYNRGLVAAMIAAHGKEKAEEWAKGFVANFARKPQGNDRAQAKAIYEGVCDVGVINTYYYGYMRHNEKNPEQQDWAKAIGVVFPNQDDRGAHVNISGAGVIKFAKNKASTIKLLEFLAGDTAQQMYAADNYEYPVKPGVGWNDEVASWGNPKWDAVSLAKIAELTPEAQMLIDRVGWQ